MAIDETKRFTFVSQGMPDDTFAVVTFKGTEGISRIYEFDITLASDDGEIDLKGVLQNPATLTIKGGDQDLPIHGAVSQFEQLNEVKGHYFYRALLVPRLRQANLYHENQLFLDKKVPDIIEEILKQAGLTTQDYELKLTRNYPQWEYICQYRETDFDFISRWMEREGIYYYFEQGEQNEKIIITDSSTAHKDIPGDATIPYFTASGLAPEEEAIKALVCTQKMLPKKVILKDYNYRKPSLELKAEAEVDSKGRGDVYLYGEHFKDPGQGTELAKIRAEEIKCRENIFHGEGTAPNLCPAFFFTLEGHYRDSYNQKYLILEVEHEGHQTGSFWAGVGEEPAEGEEKLTYANRFTAIPSDIQFRPERTTPKSKFFGTMNATIDAAGDGQHAEIDDQGRYKVILPFDQSGNKDGKASRWVRMAQPYAGSDYGVHFPLHKGAEVLLTFADGDPDRPIISSSVPNPDTISPVTTANQTTSVVRDNFGNEMIFDATPGDEHIRFYSPHHHSGIEIGKSIKSWTGSEMLEYKNGNSLEIGYGTKSEFYGGYKLNLAASYSVEGLLGIEHRLLIGSSHEWVLKGYKWDYFRGPYVQDTDKDTLLRAKQDVILGAGDEYCLAVGIQEPDKKSKNNTNKSVMRATPDGVTLSVGQELTETGEGIGEGDWYKKSGGFFSNMFDNEKSLALASLVGGVLGGVSTALAISGQAEHELPDTWMYAYAGNILALIGVAASIRLGHTVLDDKKIEPVRHVDPASKIWIHRDGTIGIVSTKGDKNQTAGERGKIVIGVNEQEKMSNENWRYYDSFRDFRKKDIRQITKVARAVAFDKSQKKKDRDAAKQELKKSQEYRSLGKGSNLIIEKDKIWVRFGTPYQETAEIKIDEEGIGIYANQDGKKGKQARITLNSKSGAIQINNEKPGGWVRIKSKENLDFETSKNIFLTAKTSGKVKVKSKEFQANNALSVK